MAGSKQSRIDAIVQRERAKGKSRAVALDIAMQSVNSEGRGKGSVSTTPIYDKATAEAKKKGRKIPTLMDQK